MQRRSGGRSRLSGKSAGLKRGVPFSEKISGLRKSFEHPKVTAASAQHGRQKALSVGRKRKRVRGSAGAEVGDDSLPLRCDIDGNRQKVVLRASANPYYLCAVLGESVRNPIATGANYRALVPIR